MYFFKQIFIKVSIECRNFKRKGSVDNAHIMNVKIYIFDLSLHNLANYGI